MKILSFLILLALLVGCSATDVTETQGNKTAEVKRQAEAQLQKSNKLSDACIRQNVNKYASNKKASYTEVAEASVSSCSKQIRSACNDQAEWASLGISSPSLRNQWKLGKTKECVESRSKFWRNLLIRKLLEKQN